MKKLQYIVINIIHLTSKESLLMYILFVYMLFIVLEIKNKLINERIK